MQYRSFWKPLDRAETPVLEWVKRVRAGGAIAQATRVLSESGQYGLAWYALGGLAAWRDEERREEWLAAVAKVAAIYAVNTGLKQVARRQRPALGDIGTPTALSFPSAHAATSFAAAHLYSELVPSARPALYAAAATMTASRLHFCVHYPTDLIAGAALGELAAEALS